jgi:hypothetical protein
MLVGFWWGKSEGKRTLEKHRRRRKDNIAVDVNGTDCVDVNYDHMSQDREKY